MYDIYSNYPPPAGVGSRRPTTSRNLLSGSERWRTSSIQERVDTWRELRRDAIRERQRLSRERDVLRRRRRHRSINDPAMFFFYRGCHGLIKQNYYLTTFKSGLFCNKFEACSRNFSFNVLKSIPTGLSVSFVALGISKQPFKCPCHLQP